MEDVETADVEGPGARKLDLHLPQMPALLLLRKWGQRSDPLKPPDEHWLRRAFSGGQGHLWPSQDPQERLQKGLGQRQPSQ